MRSAVALAALFLGCSPAATSAIHISSPGHECGAVAIGPHTALTAAHCVKWGAEKSTTWDVPGGASKPITVISAARSNDLAVLYSADQFPSYSTIRRGLEGEPVTAVSPVYQYARGQGVLQSSTDLGPAALYWETDLTIVPGWSGSPVYGTDGKVIGVISSCSGVVMWVGSRPVATCSPKFAVVAGIE